MKTLVILDWSSLETECRKHINKMICASQSFSGFVWLITCIKKEFSTFIYNASSCSWKVCVGYGDPVHILISHYYLFMTAPTDTTTFSRAFFFQIYFWVTKSSLHGIFPSALKSTARYCQLSRWTQCIPALRIHLYVSSYLVISHLMA